MNGCIIQARMGSSRLPGKTLMKLNDESSTLHFVKNQLSFSKFIDEIIVATTDLDEDDVIEEISKEMNVKCFRGSSNDVLDRYYNCAKKFQIDNIIRITADCPLIDPEIVDQVIQKYNTKNYDYVTNTLKRTYPIGTDVEIFSFEILEKTWKNAKLSSEREHVTPFIRNEKINLKIGNLENTKDLSHIRITLDHKEDLELIKQIISQINKNPILINDIMNLLSRNPELIKINQHIFSNEGMLKSLQQDRNFKN